MTQKPIGVILAGGLAQRLQGQDKGLLIVNDKPLITYTIARLKQQVSTIIISANRNIERYQKFGYPVISDARKEYQGPLAGLLSVMTYLAKAESTLDTQQLLFLSACDMPMLPTDFINRVTQTANHISNPPDSIYVAHDGHRIQQLCACMPLSLKSSLEIFLRTGDQQVKAWYQNQNLINIDYSDYPNAFHNINTIHDIESYKQLALHNGI